MQKTYAQGLRLQFLCHDTCAANHSAFDIDIAAVEFFDRLSESGELRMRSNCQLSESEHQLIKRRLEYRVLCARKVENPSGTPYCT